METRSTLAAPACACLASVGAGGWGRRHRAVGCTRAIEVVKRSSAEQVVCCSIRATAAMGPACCFLYADAPETKQSCTASKGGDYLCGGLARRRHSLQLLLLPADACCWLASWRLASAVRPQAGAKYAATPLLAAAACRGALQAGAAGQDRQSGSAVRAGEPGALAVAAAAVLAPGC